MNVYGVKVDVSSPQPRTEYIATLDGYMCYVLFENGEIKPLKRKLMFELLKDNEKLLNEYKDSHLEFLEYAEQKELYEILGYLKKYNDWKAKTNK